MLKGAFNGGFIGARHRHLNSGFICAGQRLLQQRRGLCPRDDHAYLGQDHTRCCRQASANGQHAHHIAVGAQHHALFLFQGGDTFGAGLHD